MLNPIHVCATDRMPNFYITTERKANYSVLDVYMYIVCHIC